MNLRGQRRRRAGAADSTSQGSGSAAKKPGKSQRIKEAGQIIAIFALMLTALIGLVGIAIDVTFAWREELRVQRAADAAALAGVVYLPGNVSGGVTASTQEATKNGFTTDGATVVDATPDANPRQMDVTITTPVPTFFVRIFGVNSFTVSRTAKAVYILPVPMGSPENYYGVFGMIKMRNYLNSGDTTTDQKGPGNETLNDRGFFGSVLTQGADVMNGDAYMPKDNGSGSNPQQDTVDYYNYAVVMPSGSSNGQVSIYDPAFCMTESANGYGTGDTLWVSPAMVSTYFELYDTNNSPYNLSAQTLLGSSGSLFTNMNGADTLGHVTVGPGMVECRQVDSSNHAITYTDFRRWHNHWWSMQTNGNMPALQGGHTYRIHVSTDPGDSSQDNTNGSNQFSIFASATGGTPQVYGIGAMAMYTPLSGGGTSTFYLAQIDAQAGAGKTMEIRLYDPGDTNGLPGTLQILQPTSSSWSAVSMTWTCTVVAQTHGSCPSGSGTSIVTNDSSNRVPFNGCWLTIDIVIPTTYSAPQSGWWKISYAMGGSSSTYATDETTWQVSIRGNPVHLIPG
jgi:hypothetical protein